MRSGSCLVTMRVGFVDSGFFEIKIITFMVFCRKLIFVFLF